MEKQITIPEELYNELEEYFDNRADADYQDERYIPNKEMYLLKELHQAKEQSEKQKTNDTINY